MIKGLQRQVIVVKPQESEWIEQAIFFVRVSASRHGVTQEELMDEAGRIIGEGIYPSGKKKSGLLWSRRKKR